MFTHSIISHTSINYYNFVSTVLYFLSVISCYFFFFFLDDYISVILVRKNAAQKNMNVFFFQ